MIWLERKESTAGAYVVEGDAADADLPGRTCLHAIIAVS